MNAHRAPYRLYEAGSVAGAASDRYVANVCVAKAGGHNRADRERCARDHPDAVLRDAKTANCNGRDDEHPHRVGDIVEHAVGGVGEMDSHRFLLPDTGTAIVSSS